MILALLLCISQSDGGYGRAVALCGDLDGDGRSEIAVGDTEDDPWRVFIYSGRDGGLVHTLHGRPGEHPARLNIARMDDEDGDGVREVAVFGARVTEGGVEQAFARVFSGRDARYIGPVDPQLERGVRGDFDADGYLDVVSISAEGIEITDASSAGIWTFRPDHFTPKSRLHLASPGDVDGDGADDLVVSEPDFVRRDLLGRSYAGRVFALSCGERRLLWQKLGKGYLLGIGQDLVPAGDVNGDGVPDVLSSTQRAFAGRLLCLSGADGRVIVRTGDDQTGLFPELGGELDAGEDVDGDGVPDFVCGMFNDHAIGLPDQGARVYSGKDGRLLHAFTLREQRRKRTASTVDAPRPVAMEEEPAGSWLQRFRLAEQAFSDGAYDDAVGRLESCLELAPRNATAAYHLACTHARMGRLDSALEWLERAVAWGWADAAVIEWEPDLAPLRGRSAFSECSRGAAETPAAPARDLRLVPIALKAEPLGLEPALSRLLEERGPHTIRAAVSPNGGRMLAIERYGRVTVPFAVGIAILYDADSGAGIAAFPRAETAEPGSIGFLDDEIGWFLDRARRLYMIDAESGRTLRILPPELGMPVRTFVPDHSRAALVTGDPGVVRWWRADDPGPLLRIETGTRAAPELMLLAGSSVLLTHSSLDALQAWDVASGALLWERSQRGRWWPQREFGPEGAILFDTEDGFEAVLVRSGRVDLELQLPSVGLARRRYPTFVPGEDDSVAVLRKGGGAEVIDMSTGRRCQVLDSFEPTPPLTPYRVSSEGSTARILDTRTGLPVHEEIVLPATPRITATSRAGGKLATCFEDNDMRVWDATTGGLVCKLTGGIGEGFGRRVGSMLFDPTGRTLVCQTDWAELYAFDVETGAFRWTAWPGGQWTELRATQRRLYTGYVVLDLDTGKRLLDGALSLRPTQDESRVLGWRSGLVVYDGTTLDELYERISYEDGAELVHLPSFVHSGSPEALGRARLEVDGTTYPLDSFAPLLYDPRRVRAAAAGVPVGRPALPAPPELLDLSPAGRIASVDGERGTVRARATSAEGVLGFQLERDGRVLPAVTEGKSVELQTGSAELTWVLDRPEAGVVHLVVRAIGRSGSLSRPVHMTLKW